MQTRHLDLLIDLVRTHTGIRLDSSKSYLLESRLSPVLRSEKLDSIAAFCDALSGPDKKRLVSVLVDAVTTNETSFYRDGSSFEMLASEVLPRLIRERQDSKKLRIWSAASSSGQEAATVAIMLAERFPELRDWNVKILASDVSSKMVERCASLCFTNVEIGRGMPADLKTKYFDRTIDGWKAASEVRDLIEARQINLLEPVSGVEQQDLILLRNVLIYFDEPTRQHIFTQVHRILSPDGFVLLGTAEMPRSSTYVRAFGAQSNVFQRASKASPHSDSVPEGPPHS